VNIGIVTTWFERGAAYVSRAYVEILSRKHGVFIYARGGERYARGDPRWDKEYVTWGKRVPGKIGTYVDWKEFREWVLKNDLDVVIFNEQHSWEIILKTLRGLDITIGAHVDYYTPDTAPFFWLYDFLLCHTKRHYSVFKDHPQAVFIPWGADCEVFQEKDEPVVPGEVRFFHSAGMGGVNNRKGTDILVRAFQDVTGGAKLIIHSQRGLDRYSDVAPLIRQDERIQFIKATVEAPGLYQLGDVYVYPTRLEGIGLTIAEALASGLPVVTTDAPPMNEFVIHGQNGWLVEVREFRRRADGYYWPESLCSQAALTEAMQWFVDNVQLLGEYKRRARDYAETHLDWQKNAENLSELLTGVSPHRDQCQLSELMRTVARYERKQQFRQLVNATLLKAKQEMSRVFSIVSSNSLT